MLLKCKNTAFAQGWARKKPQMVRLLLSNCYLLDFKSLAFSLNIVIGQSSKEILFPLTPYYI